MTSLRTESAWANQSPSPPSYLPVPGTKLTDDLTFMERTFNLISYFRALYIHHHVVLPRIDAVFQKHYPGVATAFDIERNASINFVNNPPIFDFARPYMPRVNFVGGLHCRNATALGGALNDFVKGASDDDGFVLITSGFTAHWEKASQWVKDAYLGAFRALPKVRFVWQYDGEPIKHLPPNVFTQSWLPQQDLLGHPKCRTHISHGGINSVIESVWHGVPTIGIPLTVAAHDNLLRISARGAGLLITKSELTQDKLVWALKEIRKNT
ncbi:UDP-glucoronosyl and UDP-glucosyl transferase [Ancylostoma caninum]|uniref:glucuronosyltransferase n=1 Tax=Ancylostoma caninum TaxID=29170 RepID=A0A368FCU8_ANCCA|nr:UDP-glucoronosyl and UDP-glucosyl transferase [Ancylostoma caninum]